MDHPIKNILLGVIAVLTVILIGSRFMKKDEGNVSNSASSAEEVVITGPLSNKDLRFDGYYSNQVGQLLYLVRFFPEGRVVTVNGTTERASDLPKFLVRETKGNPGIGLHNVPVSVEGDSLVFITHPEKGEIEYRGAVVSGSMVRFIRHSHITGTRQLMEYVFYPDGTVPLQQDSAKVVQPS
ncbi:MAG: hypothetical protein JNM62_06005 [Flavobacteriales bacterium]|nr:hypothetical protein [Flavobacteriales bacterium]